MSLKSTIELVKWQERPARTRGALPKIRGSPYPNRVVPLFLPRPPRHISHLPNDIIHLIIESHDGDADRAALARLCLVSKDFLLPSRKALYTKVTVSNDTASTEESCKLLCDSLTRHPHLAAHVRQIEIFENPNGSLSEYVNALVDVCAAVRSIFVFLSSGKRSADVIDILSALSSFAPRLKRLEIFAFPDAPIAEEVSALLQGTRELKSLRYYGPRVGEPPTFELEELILSEPTPRGTFNTLTHFSQSSLHTLDFTSRPGPGRVPAPDLSRFPNLKVVRLIAQHEDGVYNIIISALSDLSPRRLELRILAVPDGGLHVPGGRHKYHHIPPDLPLTLIHLSLDILSVDYITTFLDSGSCPLLSSATFELEAKPDPWSMIVVERAAKARGLRVVMKEPEYDGGYIWLQRIRQAQGGGALQRLRQTDLCQYWGKGVHRA